MIFRKIGGNSVVMPMFISWNFMILALLQGKSVSEGVEKVKTDVPKTYGIGLCFWPFVGVINFGLVPVLARPMFSR